LSAKAIWIAYSASYDVGINVTTQYCELQNCWSKVVHVFVPSVFFLKRVNCKPLEADVEYRNEACTV
jgi:hypothetical protein